MNVKRAWQWFWVDSVEQVGRSIEAVPGWSRFERFMDDVAEGFAFGVALLWALRWWFLIAAVGIVVVGIQN